MIHTAHIHDCFRGTMQQKLEMMSLGMMFTQTGKNLFTDLTQRTPDLLIMVTPNYWPAFEQLVFKVQHRFPYQATVYLTHIAWPVQDQTMHDFLIPHPKLVLNLADLNSLRFMYAAHDAIDEAKSRTCT